MNWFATLVWHRRLGRQEKALQGTVVDMEEFLVIRKFCCY